MELINILAAAVAAWVFGALWYGMLGKHWMDATGKKPEEVDPSDKKPFVISFVCMIIVAGMMRHIFALSGIDTITLGIMGGIGLGLFIVMPWIITHYVFAGNKAKLMLIDGGYATLGSTVMGIVLVLF
ncbi:MAG: DUF1761 domain-containing protein [Paracoccaceae bacterium]|nr:DUF1761 domain-containing protein [Paracoccaceae bacterium]